MSEAVICHQGLCPSCCRIFQTSRAASCSVCRAGGTAIGGHTKQDVVHSVINTRKNDSECRPWCEAMTVPLTYSWKWHLDVVCFILIGLWGQLSVECNTHVFIFHVILAPFPTQPYCARPGGYKSQQASVPVNHLERKNLAAELARACMCCSTESSTTCMPDTLFHDIVHRTRGKSVSVGA